MIYLCLTYGVNLGYHIFAFMIAEVCAPIFLLFNFRSLRTCLLVEYFYFDLCYCETELSFLECSENGALQMLISHYY